MPLSEEELRLLEQMERHLVEEDPKFASTLRGTEMRRTARRRAIVAGLVFAAGIALLMVGAIANLWPIGVVGFIVMLASATVGLGAMRGQQAAADPRAAGATGLTGLTVIEGGRSRGRSPRMSRTRPSGSFMERMEARWRRRRESGDF